MPFVVEGMVPFVVEGMVPFVVEGMALSVVEGMVDSVQVVLASVAAVVQDLKKHVYSKLDIEMNGTCLPDIKKVFAKVGNLV